MIWASSPDNPLHYCRDEIHGITRIGKALGGTYLCVEHYLGKPSPDPLGRMGSALHEILGEFSRELGLTPDFPIHAPPVLPRGRKAFGSFVRCLFKRFWAPTPGAPILRTRVSTQDRVVSTHSRTAVGASDTDRLEMASLGLEMRSGGRRL
jgi:hypothetical protein